MSKAPSKPYYGWQIVIALAITETVSWGIIYYAFTVFITAMETDLHGSRTEITGPFSLALLVMGAMAYPVGVWIDKHGARALMTVGSILASVLVFAWSRATDVQMLYPIWFGLGVCGACVLYEPAFAVVTVWFSVNRAKALAIITFAAGLASTIFVPLSTALMKGLGWRTSVAILAVLLAVVTIPLHALILRRRPADGPEHHINPKPPQRGKTLSTALHSRFFWLLTAAFGLAVLGSNAIRVHIIPYLTSSGLDADSAALASGAIGVMQVAGRAVFAPLERRLSIRGMLLLIFALHALAIVGLLISTSTWMILFFVVAFGTSYGASTLARVTALANEYGASHYGRISSVMSIFITIAITIAPVGTSALFDYFKSYTPVLWSILIVFGVTLALTWLIRPEPAEQPTIAPLHGVLTDQEFSA